MCSIIYSTKLFLAIDSITFPIYLIISDWHFHKGHASRAYFSMLFPSKAKPVSTKMMWQTCFLGLFHSKEQLFQVIHTNSARYCKIQCHSKVKQYYFFKNFFIDLFLSVITSILMFICLNRSSIIFVFNLKCKIRFVQNLKSGTTFLQCLLIVKFITFLFDKIDCLLLYS